MLQNSRIEEHELHHRTCHHSRRAVLAGAASAVAGALAGCLGDDEEAPDELPEAVNIEGRTCPVCGMIVGNHPGVGAQWFLSEDTDPLAYDSVREAMHDRFDREAAGESIIGGYVTDLSDQAHEVRDEGDDTYVWSSFEPDTFVEATEAVYVIGSDLSGAMGADLFPCSLRDDADDLVASYGGEVITYEEIDPELLVER